MRGRDVRRREGRGGRGRAARLTDVEEGHVGVLVPVLRGAHVVAVHLAVRPGLGHDPHVVSRRPPLVLPRPELVVVGVVDQVDGVKAQPEVVVDPGGRRLTRRRRQDGYAMSARARQRGHFRSLRSSPAGRLSINKGRRRRPTYHSSRYASASFTMPHSAALVIALGSARRGNSPARRRRALAVRFTGGGSRYLRGEA